MGPSVQFGGHATRAELEEQYSELLGALRAASPDGADLRYIDSKTLELVFPSRVVTLECEGTTSIAMEYRARAKSYRELVHWHEAVAVEPNIYVMAITLEENNIIISSTLKGVEATYAAHAWLRGGWCDGVRQPVRLKVSVQQ